MEMNMTEQTPSWSLEEAAVVLPWTERLNEHQDAIRVDIERLGAAVCDTGEVAIATHEFVEDGKTGITGLPAITAAELAAKVEEAKKAYLAFMAPHIREARIPIAVSCPTDEESNQSRYFGRPWLNEDHDWPERDGRLMNFVMQMDVSSMPGEPLGADGLLVFFHATDDYNEDIGEIFIVDTSMPGGLREAPEGIHVNPALKIVDWRTMPDVLWGDDTFDLEGAEAFEAFSDYFGDTIGEYIGVDGKTYEEHEGVKLGIIPALHTFECDKVGGQPRWEQGNDTPDDDEGNPMRYILQVGDEGVVGDYDKDSIEWPTIGRGQIFFSEETGTFKYVWACD
jgi:hypothetical protein